MYGDARTVKVLPECGFHKGKAARYEALTIGGTWKPLCLACFKEKGVNVGLNFGQRLWLPYEIHGSSPQPWAAPIAELPPVRPQYRPVESACGVCGAKWFRHALGYIQGVGYCTHCLRQLGAGQRWSGPFTFGDTLEVTYPKGPDEGMYIGRLSHFPAEDVLQVRYWYTTPEYAPEDCFLYHDGMDVWWDVDRSVSGLQVLLASEQSVRDWDRFRKSYLDQHSAGRRQHTAWLFDQAE